jgi:hypothetical protein
MGDNGMYLTRLFSFEYTGKQTDGYYVNIDETTIDCTSPIDGYMPIMIEIYKSYSNSMSPIRTDYAYLIGNTAYAIFVSNVESGKTGTMYAKVIYKKD